MGWELALCEASPPMVSFGRSSTSSLATSTAFLPDPTTSDSFEPLSPDHFAHDAALPVIYLYATRALLTVHRAVKNHHRSACFFSLPHIRLFERYLSTLSKSPCSIAIPYDTIYAKLSYAASRHWPRSRGIHCSQSNTAHPRVRATTAIEAEQVCPCLSAPSLASSL